MTDTDTTDLLIIKADIPLVFSLVVPEPRGVINPLSRARIPETNKAVRI